MAFDLPWSVQEGRLIVVTEHSKDWFTLLRTPHGGQVFLCPCRQQMTALGKGFRKVSTILSWIQPLKVRTEDSVHFSFCFRVISGSWVQITFKEVELKSFFLFLDSLAVRTCIPKPCLERPQSNLRQVIHFGFEFPMAMAVLKTATLFMQLAFSQDWERDWTYAYWNKHNLLLCGASWSNKSEPPGGFLMLVNTIVSWVPHYGWLFPKKMMNQTMPNL